MPTPTPPAEQPGQIAMRALVRADRFLDAAGREIPAIAGHMRRGELAAVRVSLDHLLDGFGSLARLAVDLTRVRGTADAESFDLGGMARALRDFVHCQEAGDWAAAADILEGTILPMIPSWRDLFHRHAAALEAARGAAGAAEPAP
ncbi:MAG: hypothetical protein D6718_13945 [Acidobacteria bacterium]|nr:MAG: hypothetical protein D6718_13945 [Acidobacteriota bacterium]